MATTWPAFRHDGSPTVERLDKNIHFESQGGQEWSLNLWPNPRYRYTFQYRLSSSILMTVSPWTAYTELAAFLSLVNTAKGDYAQFTVTDPSTGSGVTCRLDTGSLKLQQASACPWWEATVSFISQI